MSDIISQLEKDGEGNILLNPVIGWALRPAAEISGLLAIQYIQTPQEFETGGKTIAFVLTPQQCLELSAALTKLAKRMLDPLPPGKPPN